MGIQYRPELDGLRAVAALVVLLFHTHMPFFGGGFAGVDLFFVLSGYLITSLLMAEQARTGTIALKTFYLRRARRLVPPLALMLAIYLAVFPLIEPERAHYRDALLAFLYVSDYTVPYLDMPWRLRHTWSLSVEEHFYLLWPLVFLWVRPKIHWLLIAFVVVTMWRCSYIEDWRIAYPRFDTRLSGLLLGCAMASIPRDWLRWLPAWPGLLWLAYLVVTGRWRNPYDHGLGGAWVEMASAIAILGRAPKWLSHPWLVYIGKLSYGIYLYHFPIVDWMGSQRFPPLMTLSVTVLLSFGLAALSYHTLEAYFRRTSVSGTASSSACNPTSADRPA